MFRSTNNDMSVLRTLFCLALVVAPASSLAAVTFDMTQREGEHALGPVTRVLTDVLKNIDANVHDYSCTFTKRERIDGELGEDQHIFMKVRHQHFSVYMRFLQPYTDREVIYVEGQNDGNMLVLDCGWKRKVGVLRLNPEGMIAMKGQKHPITSVGIRNLTDKILTLAKKDMQKDMQWGECKVVNNPNQELDGRNCTMIQVVHPNPRKEFKGHIARLFIDNKLRVPIYYDSYKWPDRPGGAPPLEESYMYRNLQINNGFSARDFDKNNPEIFKP